MSRPDMPRSFSADRLHAALTNVGGPDRPAYLDDIVAQALRTPQRPAWAFLERWLPMTATFPTAPPTAGVRPLPRSGLTRGLKLVVLALLTVALIGAALFAAATNPMPDPDVRNGLIAFDAQRDIWVVNGDGSALRRLTETPDSETSPVWSPDGSQLAVWITRAGDTSIAIMDGDGSVEQTIDAPHGSTFPQANTSCNLVARWSPDGRMLAAPAMTERLQPGVAIVDVASGDGHLLDIGMPVCGFDWSPVGSLLAFTAGGPGEEGIYVSDPDGRNVRRVSPEDAGRWTVDSGTRFGPDGAWIAADQSEPLGQETVVVLGLDGSERTLGPGGAASVSPDGRWVSFVRGEGERDAPRELYVAPSDGSAEPRLVSDEVCACWAVWSPDSTRLATFSPSWDEVLLFDPFGESGSLRVPSLLNIGVLSWQALS